MKPSKTNTQSGNAFIFILLGVILFAALSFTVSRGLRSNTTSALSQRQATLAATEITAYAQRLERAVNTLRRKGCSESEISFENPTTAGYINASSPGDKSCHIFDPAGANVPFQIPDSDFLIFPTGTCDNCGDYSQYYFDSRMCIPDVGTGSAACRTNGTSSDTELTLVLPWIKKEICLEINNRVGVTNPSGDAPTDTNGSWGTKFQGNFIEESNIGDTGTGLTSLPGKSSGCWRHTNATLYGDPPNYHFYHVLLAR